MFGDVPVQGHPGVCCAKGQTYDPDKEICVGDAPECPDDMKVGKYGCHYKDKITARAQHRVHCEEGSLLDCHYYGQLLYYGGKGLALDMARGREVFERNCRAGFMRSCGSLGHTHMRVVTPIPRDTELARKLIDLACQSGHANACSNRTYISQEWDNEKEHMIEHATRACSYTGKDCYKPEAMTYELEDTPAADRKLVGYLREQCLAHKNSTICDQYLNKARLILKQSEHKSYSPVASHIHTMCVEEGYWAFCQIAIQYKIWLNEDYSKQANVLSKACKDKEHEACQLLSYTLITYNSAEDTKEDSRARWAAAAAPMRMRCEEGHGANDCARLARAHEQGKGVALDYARALTYYKRACELFDYSSCQKVGEMALARQKRLRDPRNLDEARIYYEMACQRGYNASCTQLGILYYNNQVKGTSKKESEAKGFELHRYTCEGKGHAYGCYFLAAYYKYGMHVKQDPEQADRYRGLACQYGQLNACLDILKEGTLDSTQMLEKLVNDSTLAIDTARDRILSDPDEREHKRVKKMYTPEEMLERVLKQLNRTVNHCDEYRDDEECAYIKVRFSNIVKVAYKQYRLECEAGDAHACYKRGELNLYNMGSFKRDPNKFMPYMKRGCELGSPRACSIEYFAKFYGYYGVTRDALKAHKASYRRFMLELEQEEGYRYTAVKHALHTAAATGEDVDLIITQAFAHCARQDEERTQARCEDLINRVINRIVQQHPFVMSAHLERACESTRQPEVCARHARALYERDPDRASEVAQSACLSEEEPDCSELARQFLFDPARRQQAIDMLVQACHEAGNEMACGELGEQLITSEHLSEQARAREAFKAGCEENHATSCHRMGELYMGLGHVPKDEDRAMGFFKTACDHYHLEACMEWDALRDAL